MERYQHISVPEMRVLDLDFLLTELHGSLHEFLFSKNLASSQVCVSCVYPGYCYVGSLDGMADKVVTGTLRAMKRFDA